MVVCQESWKGAVFHLTAESSAEKDFSGHQAGPERGPGKIDPDRLPAQYNRCRLRSYTRQ